MRRNRLRELLKADEPSLGTHIHSSWPTMMKIEQEPRTYLTVRAIGSGIQNVLFADPRT